METYFESQWHRQPTPPSFRPWWKTRSRRGPLSRGLAMGLDKDDTIVKRRMAQKMQFLAEDVAAAHEPSTADSRPGSRRIMTSSPCPAAYSFRHLYFSPDKRGKNAQRGRRQGAGQNCRPAGRLEARRFARRPVHVPGLLRRPRARAPSPRSSGRTSQWRSRS